MDKKQDGQIKNTLERQNHNKLAQSLNDYDNQKQLRVSQQTEDVSVLSGDESTDNRVLETDMHQMLDDYVKLPGMAGTFMKPMHDASIDDQFAPRASEWAKENEGEREP